MADQQFVSDLQKVLQALAQKSGTTGPATAQQFLSNPQGANDEVVSNTASLQIHQWYEPEVFVQSRADLWAALTTKFDQVGKEDPNNWSLGSSLGDLVIILGASTPPDPQPKK